MARAPPPARYAELVAAIRAADAALAAANPRAVVARLTTARVWRWQELQSLARLAEAWLQLSPANPEETAARLVALGGYLRAVALVRAGRGRELPLLAEAWNAARISDIEARARAALSLPDPPPYLDQIEGWKTDVHGSWIGCVLGRGGRAPPQRPPSGSRAGRGGWVAL